MEKDWIVGDDIGQPFFYFVSKDCTSRPSKSPGKVCSPVHAHTVVQSASQGWINKPCLVDTARFWHVLHWLGIRDGEMAVGSNPFGGLLHRQNWCWHRLRVSDLTVALYQKSAGTEQSCHLGQEGWAPCTSGLASRAPVCTASALLLLFFCSSLLSSRWHKLCQQNSYLVYTKSFHTGNTP